MYKVKYNRATGSVFGQTDENERTTRQSSGIFSSIINNVGGWLDSIGQTIVGTTAARHPVTVEDNTPKVLAIAGVGVAAVTLIIALLIIFKN